MDNFKFISLEDFISFLKSANPDFYYNNIEINCISYMCSKIEDEMFINTMKRDLECFPDEWSSMNDYKVNMHSLGITIMNNEVCYFLDSDYSSLALKY